MADWWWASRFIRFGAMREEGRITFRGSLVLVGIGVVACTLALAQQPANFTSNELRYDTGALANGTYTNECLGFSLPIPDGWQVNIHSGGSDAHGRATHLPGQGLGLLVIDRYKDYPSRQRIVVTARDASRFTLPAKDYVTAGVQLQISSNPENRHRLQEAFAVEYGGRQFYRSDYKQDMPDGHTMYLALVYTKYRGYLLGETLIAGSSAALEESANSLLRISFGSDQANPKCVFGGASAATGGH
jgi:hypothetical protein